MSKEKSDISKITAIINNIIRSVRAESEQILLYDVIKMTIINKYLT